MMPDHSSIQNRDDSASFRHASFSGAEHQPAAEPAGRKSSEVELVLSFLQDRDPEIRKIAADRLAAPGMDLDKAVPHLMIAITQETEPQITRSLLKALIASGHAGEPSLVFLVRSADNFLQLETIRALAASTTISALTLPALECIMRTSSGDAAKEAGKAITALYKKPIPANFLQGDLNRFGVEWTKRLYLAPKGATPAQPPPYTDRERDEREKLAKGLLAIYTPDEPGIKIARLHMAEQALVHINLSEKEKILTKVLLHFGLRDSDAGVQNATLKLLRTLRPDMECLAPLLLLATGAQEPVCDRAVSAIREISGGSAIAIEMLVDQAMSGDSQRIIPALACLGKLCLHPSPRVLAAFKAGLDSSDDEVVSSAANGLFELKPWSARGAVELFVKMLENPDPAICRQGLSSFTEFMFLAVNDEKELGLKELERIVKQGPRDPNGRLTSRQRELITAAAVLASGSLAVSTTPEVQRRAIGLLAYAAQDPGSLDARRAAYAGLYTIARQSDNGQIISICRQSLDWALEEEKDEDARVMVQAYLDNIDPPAPRK